MLDKKRWVIFFNFMNKGSVDRKVEVFETSEGENAINLMVSKYGNTGNKIERNDLNNLGYVYCRCIEDGKKTPL